MIHLVPAWYNPARPWYSTDGAWYRSMASQESDDTVTQARIFHQGDEEAALIVLNYAPSLRRFLHGQDIAAVPYWSFFDEVQGLSHDYARSLDFLDLEWPDDVSFFYNPFIVTAMRGSDVYARIYLAREGTLQSIRYYGEGMPTLERIFDDRGFLSSVLMHGDDGQPMTQYYLSRTGDVIVSEDVPSGRIEVVQNDQNRFKQQAYDGWEALMAEFLDARLGSRRGRRDTVVLAVAEQHNALITSALRDETLVLSRSARRRTDVAPEVLDRAGAVFSDVGAAADDPGLDWATLPELAVYPLERRDTFGASANESIVYISLFVDTMTPEELDYAIALMAGHLVDESVRLRVCTFRSQDLDHLQQVRRVISGYQRLDLQFLEGDDIAALSADLGATDELDEKIQLAFLDRESELIRTMATSRVFIDLGARVHGRLATEAVNAGVPQINRHPQELVTHPLNGYVIDDVSELGTALDHFLGGLEHWNQSLVQCRVLQDLFRPDEVLARWDLIREAVAYAGPTDRA